MEIGRGTKLINRRSRKEFMVSDIFNTASEKTNWETMRCYRLRRSVNTWDCKFSYVLENELDRYEIMSQP